VAWQPQLAQRAVAAPPAVRQAVCLRLVGRQLGDVDRHYLQTKLLCCFPPRVPHDDHAVAVDDDRLAETELANRGGNGIDGAVTLVWFDPINGPEFDKHGGDELCSRRPTGC
jgi:hypothetical protein